MNSILTFAALLIFGLLAIGFKRGLLPSPATKVSGKTRRIAAAVAGLLGTLATSLADLFVAGAEAVEREDDSDTAPSGGVLNYRTGKLDDGTDPVGWYEKD